MRVLFFTKAYGTVTTTFIRNEVDYLLQHATFRYLCQTISGTEHNSQFVTAIPFEENFILRKIRWELWQKDRACIFYNPSYSRKVKKFIEGFDPQIIHCHFAYEAIALLDNIDFKKYKVVIHFHGYDASQMLRKRSYIAKLRQIFRHENVFPVCINIFFIGRLSAQLGIPESRFIVLRCGVDLSVFHEGLIRDKRENAGKIFLQVSSLVEKKGHEYTLQAFAIFLQHAKGGNFQLILTGDGERKKPLMELAEKLNISSHVRFAGNVKPPDAAKLMGEADVFLHHSITPENGDQEGIPTAVMEAMAMELPVVSTLHSGIPELVEDGVNGYLVHEKDVEAYAVAMGKALQMGRLPGNRLKVEQHYNKEKHNQQLQEIYSSILLQDEPAQTKL